MNTFYYLLISSILFIISILGIFLNKKNIIIIIMSLELMFLSINMNFLIFSNFFNDILGQIFVFFILTVSAAETAISLAFLIKMNKNLNNINIQKLHNLKK